MLNDNQYCSRAHYDQSRSYNVVQIITIQFGCAMIRLDNTEDQVRRYDND